MSVMVRIPSPLRRLTNGQDKVEAEGESLEDVIAFLEGKFPGIRERLCDNTGQLRNFVNVYVNGEDVRFLESLSTSMAPGDEISVVPAVAGGRL
jgi:molybdopterin synthase sulfur carrier subunit